MAGKRQSVGVIGLGIIGSRVASNLRKSGFEVWVWNRSPKPEPNFLASPEELADAADTILIFVADGPALLETVHKLLPSLSARHVLVNHATVGAEEAAEAGAIAERASAGFVNAPFTGSRDAAAAGRMVYYLGGAPELMSRVLPVLNATAKSVIEIGDVRQASLVKIATNLVSATTVEAIAEAMAVLDRHGVPLGKFAEAIESNAICSGVTQNKIPGMVSGNFEPHFALKHMFKDIQLVIGAGADAGLEMPAANAVAGALMAGIQKGWADLDFSALACHYGYPGKQDMQSETDSEAAAEAEIRKPRRKFGLFGGGRKD